MSAPLSREFADADVALIGVDGGASSVKAWAVRRSPGDRGWIADGPKRKFEHRCEGFEPIPIELQRAELSTPIVGGAERRAGEVWMANTVRAIVEIARELGRSRVAVALAMPGVKTDDGRGILASRNGPRIVDFVARLEVELAKANLELAVPIPALLSDGYAAALGERFGLDGALRHSSHAYYLGAGTGLSEALLLDGRVRSMDEVVGWFPKAWTLKSALGRSYEDELSASGINRRYADLTALPLPLAPTRFVEAQTGDAIARRILAEAGAILGELLLVHRLPELDASPWKGASFERIVLGQRFASLARSDSQFRRSVLAVADRHAERLGELVVSNLEASVAIGAIAKLCGAEETR